MNSSTEIIVAISSAAIGVVLANFKDEIVNFFRPRKYNGLLGTWSCTWIAIETPGITITDTVEVIKINGRLISGTGNTPVIGKWHFKGEISDNTISLTYKFDKSNIVDNAGVIILKLGNNPTGTMNGVWSQYKDPDLKGGTTTWVKI